MGSWADRQKKQADLLRGQGKHEELLLQCKLREHRHPFRNSLQMKYMDKEKLKIQNELTKIRHTIHHERRNSRAHALSYRHLTKEAMAPRRSLSAFKPQQPTPRDGVAQRSLRGFDASRMSLDPSLLAAAETSLTHGIQKSKIAAKESGFAEDSGLVSSVIPEINDVNENAIEVPQVTLAPPPEGGVADVTVDQSEGIGTAEINVDLPQHTTDGAIISTEAHTELHHLIAPIDRLCRRQATFIPGRQPSFINRSNTYIKRRKEMANSSDVLSCVDYNTMREGIANETLNKLGLLHRP